MTKDTVNRHWVENEETAQQRIDQAQALKPKASRAGLKCEVYLPSDIAVWVLDMVEKGVFIDPSEAIYVFMDQAHDIDDSDDLKTAILKHRVLKGEEDYDNGRIIEGDDLDEFFETLKNEIKEDLNVGSAIWKPIKQPDIPEDIEA